MSNENTGPAFTAKGRDFFDEDGAAWLLVQLDSERYHVKVSKADLARALLGEPFQAHHPTLVQMGAPAVYLPSLTGTLDPWFLSGARCGVIAQVHPDLFPRLDERIKKAFSTILTVDKPPLVGATEAQLDRATKPSHLHLA